MGCPTAHVVDHSSFSLVEMGTPILTYNRKPNVTHLKCSWVSLEHRRHLRLHSLESGLQGCDLQLQIVEPGCIIISRLGRDERGGRIQGSRP